MSESHHGAPSLSEAQRRKIYIEEQLRKLSQPILSSPRRSIAYIAFPILFGAFYMWQMWERVVQGEAHAIGLILFITVGFPLICLGIETSMRSWYRARLQGEDAAARAAELQEELEENFVTNLVKINFKYIDKYYYQTQAQANKSFILSALAALISFAVVIIGIALLYRAQANAAQQLAGIIATVAGLLGQFVSAVFFYLYNNTVAKMAEYHQKLVLTQNLSLALKISEDLEGDARTRAQLRLIDYLAADINAFLTGTIHNGASRPLTPSSDLSLGAPVEVTRKPSVVSGGPELSESHGKAL